MKVRRKVLCTFFLKGDKENEINENDKLFTHSFILIHFFTQKNIHFKHNSSK